MERHSHRHTGRLFGDGIAVAIAFTRRRASLQRKHLALKCYFFNSCLRKSYEG